MNHDQHIQQTADFGREQKRRVSVIAQERVEACFGQTEAVKRRGIKQAATGGPSRVQCFAGEAVIKRYVNLGMAVAVDDGKGLLVPSIKNAETLNLLGLAQAVKDFAERGRAKQLTIEDLTGGTFTITNPGVFGSLYGTPIIPVGQVGILDTGAIVRRQMVVQGPDGSEAIAIRPMMYISLSFDHRLIDGALADQFMTKVKQVLDLIRELETGAAEER